MLLQSFEEPLLLESEIAFFDLAIWEKDREMNPAWDWSYITMIPINSFLWIMPLIAPMSVVLSQKTSRSVKPKSFADPSAASIASASASRGEATNACAIEPSISLANDVPEKFQASLAVFRVLSQAASVLHVIVPSSREAFVELLVRWCVLPGKGLLLISLFWAWFHSRADRSPFVAVFSGGNFLSSKTKEFLEVQIDQSTQGRMAPTIPVGGRQIVSLKRVRTSVNSIPAAMWTARKTAPIFSSKIEELYNKDRFVSDEFLYFFL